MTLIELGLAVLIGTLMGLLGGGGSIVAVPAFTLILGLAPKDAVVASLLVVGIAATAGAVSAWLRGLLPLRTAAIVGLSAGVGAFAGGMVGARLSDDVQIKILAAVMLCAAIVMWLRQPPALTARKPVRAPLLGATGVGVGAITGLVGVGGGFMMVPALVVAAGLPIAEAGAASLFVIALSAAAALPAYVSQTHLQWGFIAPFSAASGAAVLLAGPLAPRLPQRLLQRAFAAALVILGSFLLLRT